MSTPNHQPGERFPRVLLKLSGEAFAGDGSHGVIDYAAVATIASEVAALHKAGTEIAIVVGGGNVMRGTLAEKAGMERVTADYIGTLGTVVNALALQDSLEQQGVDTRVQTALPIQAVAEPYIRRRALRHLEKGRVVILAGGTGNPYFTTDTASALRASEVRANAMLMAKNGTDGVYDKDPRQHADAVKFDKITYTEAIDRRLKVMDLTALTFCMENNMPIVVFDINVPGNIQRVGAGEQIGTIVTRDA
ncbi:MAG: uridylate kinase [Capsulimonas sp.]|jgi:uridylate kinase|nr:uridylate kinase [Capsulimonas sp.]